jgi:hypothetical protein
MFSNLSPRYPLHLALCLPGAWCGSLSPHSYDRRPSAAVAGALPPPPRSFCAEVLRRAAHATRHLTRTHVWRKAPRCCMAGRVARLRHLMVQLGDQDPSMCSSRSALQGLRRPLIISNVAHRASSRHPPSHFHFYVAGSQLLIACWWSALLPPHPNPLGHYHPPWLAAWEIAWITSITLHSSDSSIALSHAVSHAPAPRPVHRQCLDQQDNSEALQQLLGADITITG